MGGSDMNYRKLFGLMAVAALAGLFVSACSTEQMPSTEMMASREPLRIGLGSWAGFGAAYIADAKGFFKEAGVDVEIVKFDTYDKAAADFAGKRTDGSLMVLSDAVNQSAAGIPLQVVWVLDSSNGADVVV